MLKAFVASVLLIWLGGIALAEPPETSPPPPSLKSEQQSDRALNSQEKPELKAKSSGESVEIPAQNRSADEAHQASDEASEFTTVFNRRFKITDLLLVIFTAGLFVATLALWHATKDLVDDAKKNSERQLRASIFPQELVVSDVELGKRPAANMVVKNTGLTPATDVIAWAGVWVGDFPLQAELIRSTPEFMKTASRRSVGPGAAFTINHVWNEVLTEQHIQMLRNGTAAVFVWGEITYVDVFGQKRTTGFRSYYGGNTGLRAGGATTTSQDGNNSD